MSGDSGSVGAASPPGVFERAPAEAQTGLAALATAVADAEHRAAELAEAFDERTAELTQARERVAYLESTLAQRDQELALRLQRLVEIKASLSWQLMAPFRELYRPIRRLQKTRFGVRLRAAWRHPLHSHKRKAFRANRMAEYAAAHCRHPQRPSKLEAKLRALLRYPFSPEPRRAYRALLRRGPPPPPLPPSSRATLASLIDFSSRTAPNYNGKYVFDLATTRTVYGMCDRPENESSVELPGLREIAIGSDTAGAVATGQERVFPEKMVKDLSIEIDPARPTVAAIIPLYNGAPFIREALESVLAQTDPVDEIIVVDDGSTDDGPQIVKAMAANHPIRILTKENGGQSSARNLGIAECTSSHIALLDQDDMWYPDHIATLKQPFITRSKPDLALVYGNLDQIDRSGRMVLRSCLDGTTTAHPKMSLFDCLQKDMFILPGASLFSKAAFNKLGGFDERLSGYEDDDLFLRMFSAGYDSVYIKRAVSKWRIYPGSTSFSARMAKSRMIYFHKLTETYPNEPRLSLYWVRDCIAPRFLNNLRDDFIDGSRQHDVARVSQAWSDIKQVIPFLRPKIRRRLRRVAPFIDLLHKGPFVGVARRLFRRAERA